MLKQGKPLSSAQMAVKYAGEAAADYEARRAGGFKWEFERAAVEALLPRCASVLDVPVGTGRFLQLYHARGIAATGLDVAADMLAEAARKPAPAQLLQGDLFTHRFDQRFDCVVCVRLVNWLGPRLQELLDRLAELSARHVLLSVTTTTGPTMVKATGAVILNGGEVVRAFASAGLVGVGHRSLRLPECQTSNVLLLEKHGKPA